MFVVIFITMNIPVISLFFLSIIFSLIGFQNSVIAAKLDMPEYIYAAQQKLILNGAGIRNKYYMDLYVCALYLKNKSSDAQKIMDSDEVMGIRLHIISNWITSKKMQQAIQEGFNKATNNHTAHIDNEIKTVITAFNDAIVKDDVFEMHYIPGQGSLIYKNNQLKCTIKGLPFKQALFGIWLSKNNPNHLELRKQLMGG